MKAQVPWEQGGGFYTEAIEPVAKEGADIRVDVNILTKCDTTAWASNNSQDPRRSPLR